MKLGAVAILTKPFTPDEFIGSVSSTSSQPRTPVAGRRVSAAAVARKGLF
jgi:FixJ family two-component response regulator